MADNADDLREANPWHPITNRQSLKRLGKLAEEAGELVAAISRCIIQGVMENEPVTNKPNKLWLAEEIADVEANIKLVKEYYQLDEAFIRERAERKELYLRQWHRLA